MWTPHLSHGLLQLCNDQNDKGHWKGTCLDEIGWQSVRAEFLKLFGLDLPWKIFKHRMDHLKKQYDVYKRITRNATGLGFNEAGEINMESDWWNELIKVSILILNSFHNFKYVYNENTYILLKYKLIVYLFIFCFVELSRSSDLSLGFLSDLSLAFPP